MLTPKQEAFCLAFIQTGNASEAYRTAYQAEAMAPTTVNRSAKELVDNPKIAARLVELRKEPVEHAQITLTQHLEELRQLRDKAIAAGKYGPAVQAEIARGKAAGLYEERIRIEGVTVSIKDYTGRDSKTAIH